MITERVFVKDICKIRSGKRLPKGTDFSESTTAFPYIRARDIKQGRINGEDLVYLPNEVHERIKQYIVNTNDIVITIVGASVGDVAYVSEEFDGFNLTENAVRLTEFIPNVNSKFILYLLNSKRYWELMQQIAGGSAQPKLGIYKIENIPVDLPRIEIQNKIVKILSSFDNLIENNQKQIKLLEEAAQRLYQEWFVDLRFPGYEETTIVNGVPEGWERVSLSKIAPIVTGKKDANYGTQDGKYPFFTCAKEPILAPAYSFDCDAVILAGNGDFNVKLYRGKFEAYQRTYVLSPFETKHLYLLFHAVRESMNQLFQGASGSTIKFLTKHMLEDIFVLLPTDEILEKYINSSESFQKKIECLKAEIKISQEARDRIMTRLMTGEIQV